MIPESRVQPTPQPAEKPVKGILNRLVAPSPAVTDEEQRQQARLLSTLLFVIATFLLVGLVASSIRRASEGNEIAYVFAIATLCMLLSYGLSRSRYYYAAGICAFLTLSLLPFGELAAYHHYAHAVTILMWLILPIILSTGLLKLRDQVILVSIEIAGLVVLLLFGPQVIHREVLLVTGLLLTTFGLLVVLHQYRQRLEHNRQRMLLNSNQELHTIRASLEAQVAERTRSAEEARAEAEAANLALEAQVWQVVGLTELAKVTREIQTLPELSTGIIRQICRYAGIAVGALFINEDDILRLVGSYAYPFTTNPSPRYRLGSGVVGEAAQDKQVISLRDIPENYLPVTSGLGEITPAQILAVPCLYQNQVEGVMELASLELFTNDQIQFITATVELIASALHATRSQSQVTALFAKTQQQADDLQLQQAELQRIKSDLGWRERELHRKEQALQRQNDRQPADQDTAASSDEGEVANDA